ncbi:MAG: HNH endonuclease signature motif containing protein [Albidovulum sp.]
MNRFFLKVHGNEKNCPGGFGLSRNKADWEGQAITLPKAGPVYARKDRRNPAPDIQPGDELWIWTHESSGGHGLSAEAVVHQVLQRGALTSVLLKGVELVSRPFGYKAFPRHSVNGHVTGSRLLNYTSTMRPSAVYLIEEGDYSEFLSVVEQRGGVDREQRADSEDNAAYWEMEVLQHKEDLIAGLQNRKTATQKARPGQAQFRDKVMQRYEGRCVITKCPISEALEAAHVMPQTSDRKWDHPDNGLLLRRDLHGMFDKMLWSIDPKSNKMRLAERLKVTAYRKLDGREVKHRVAIALLEVHFAKFRNGGSND